MIDFSIVAASEDRLWCNLVTFFEFKINTEDLVAAVGQVIMRSHTLFECQPDRTFVFALVLSLDVVRVCRIRKLSAEGSIQLEISSELSLSIGSPAAMWTGM
uniref:Uncharacterized protein n=1 Tax=Chlamydomonas chlamydogama TaxID=225041 RepID=A0A7S2VUC6_9CHLO|mmetsp:Transcript_1228/g.2659  ORF Transcript_1228/g.2659 Transcript_1228/m.2659 type:complete len:102 (+) Transcript_1228:418-723(+)